MPSLPEHEHLEALHSIRRVFVERARTYRKLGEHEFEVGYYEKRIAALDWAIAVAIIEYEEMRAPLDIPNVLSLHRMLVE